ncbi:ABC transporter permease [Streptomyces sp. MMG1533]|uniref:ABC transporter permease n=1 Tax=Streptomyces sp. MMG1533 TaxID=1415546 RepID=UPI000AFF593D|nr:ABC transporter permease [Streptomyces sp. MMG1533]
MSSVTAPWVRTRLRTAPGTACALALLVALTACLAAAFPRAVDRYGDAGLHHAVERARPEQSGVQVAAPVPSPLLPQTQREDALRPDTLSRQYGEVRALVPGPLTVDRGQSTYGVRTTTDLVAQDPWLPRPTGLPAQVSLVAQEGVADHADLRAGRLPRAAGQVTAATAEVEAAVTVETAESLRIKAGSVIHVPGVDRAPLAVRVTAIVAPRDPAGAYWSVRPLLRTPTLVRLPGPSSDADRYWLGALLLTPEAAPATLGTAGNPERYWQLTPATDALHAHDTDRLRSAIASLESGPALQKVRTAIGDLADEYTSGVTEVSTDLDDVLASYARLREGVDPLVAVAAFGTGTVAAVVLLMAGGLAADRRRTELALLRARGASLRGVTGRLLAETTVIALPAGALGLTAALLALPAPRTLPAVLAAAAVTAVACAALPLRAAAAHRTVRVHGGREDVTSIRPSRRRTVAELTLVVLAAGAVESLRRRGTSGSAGDQLVSLAPVLIGVIAALVLVRLYPLPLRALARPAGRLRGAVGHLSLARAGRTSVSAALPLLALLTALTTAAFGGSVLAGVREARDHAALLTVGADARIETTGPLPAALTDRIRSVPGVDGVAEASIAYQAKPDEGRETVPLVGVDPGEYAALTGRVGTGAFGEGELTSGAASGSASGSVSGAASGPASQSASAPASGPASGSASGPASGPASGSASGPASGPASGSASGPASSPASGSASGSASGAGESGSGTAGTGGTAAPLPALASPATAATYGTRPFPVGLEDGNTVTVRITVVRDRTPAISGAHFLVVDRAGLGGTAARPTALLLTGDHLDARALRRAAGDAATVQLRAEERARYVDSPLQSGAERVYTTAVAAGVGYAVLALLLALLRAAPERTALLARLRTLGLTRAQGRRLLVLESLPQAVLAALGGTLTGWAAIRLLSPGIDLTTIALASKTAPGKAELHADALSLTVPAVSVLLLAVGVAVGQAWWSGRRGSVRELRAGDAR